MLIKFNKNFKKQYDKADLKIQSTFQKKLKLFLNSPFHSQLNNHQLTGRLSGYRSINITGDWRALYSEYTMDSKRVIIFEMIGTHSQLYK